MRNLSQIGYISWSYKYMSIVIYKSKCLTDKVETYSLQGFGNYAKQYMLKSYNVTCLIENCYIYSRYTGS